MSFALENAFVIISLFCLIWASYEDLKHRLVPDKIWLVQIVFALPFLVIWFIDYANFLMRMVAILNLVFSFILAIVFFMLGSFGGGDSKAIIALSFTTPVYLIGLSLGNVSNESMPAVLGILTNMLLFILVFALVLLLRNLKSKSKYGGLFSETSASVMGKLAILISGRRVPADVIINLTHDDPAEKYEDEIWSLHTPLFSEQMEDDEYEKMEIENRENAHQQAKETSRSYLWVRPQPPGLVFLLLGYIYWIFLGSPILYFFS